MHVIKRSCEIKAQVVAEDEQESDRRSIFNYGHTIGHALESLAGYRGLIHGEAVGIGLVQEADLACHMGSVRPRRCRTDQKSGAARWVVRSGLTSHSLSPSGGRCSMTRRCRGARYGCMAGADRGGGHSADRAAGLCRVVSSNHGRGSRGRRVVGARQESIRRRRVPRGIIGMRPKTRHLWRTSNRLCGKKHAKSMCCIGSSESISNTLDLEAVLRHIVDVVVEVTKADACLLYLLSDGRDELILRASKNPHPKLIGRITIGLGEGITGWVARERTRVVIPNNASEDPRFKFFNNLPEDRYQAFVSVPIMAKKEVSGVINVQHKRSRRYRDDELALLSTIANQVGGAIENARLYDQMRRKALQLETLVASVGNGRFQSDYR